MRITCSDWFVKGVSFGEMLYERPYRLADDVNMSGAIFVKIKVELKIAVYCYVMMKLLTSIQWLRPWKPLFCL